MAEVSFENKNVLNFDNDELSGYSDNQIIDSATSELSITDASGEITIETTEKKQMQPGLIKYLHYVCTAQATIAKNSVESKAIEIKVKQADLKAIHDCMALINKDANEKGVDIHFNSPAKIEGLDELSRVKANEQQQRVEAILQAAKDAGVDLDETKLNYDFYERGNLIDNLKLQRTLSWKLLACKTWCKNQNAGSP